MIHVEMKPAVQPVGPWQLRELTAYRVDSVNDEDCGVQVGDIVLKFPSKTGGHFILNATKQVMLFDRSNSSQYSQPFLCFRAHSVKSITFCMDEDDAPVHS